MLRDLFITNYILIDEITIRFGEGLNIITGETGAGKSILVDALAAVLGDALSRDKIRSGENRAVFEAHFEIENQELADLLAENEIESTGAELIIRRELNDTGRSRCFLNDTPVPLPLLKQVGDLLIDMHGQHEHQLLLQPGRHIDYLDAFAQLGDLVRRHKTAYSALKDDQKQLWLLQKSQDEATKTRELLAFQFQEISAVNPQADEEEKLGHEELILRNAEKLHAAASHWYGQLYENDGAVCEVLAAAAKQLSELAQIDVTFAELAGECENAALIVNDAASALQRYAAQVMFDAERLEEIRLRMAALNGLKKKYGGTLPAVLEHFGRVRHQLAAADHLGESIAELQSQIETKRGDLQALAAELSQRRKAAATLLSEQVTQELSGLGMARAQFSVTFTIEPANGPIFVKLEEKPLSVGPKGVDHVEFIICTNPGEPFKPLAEVASGGEASRVMLALKTRLAETDQVPVLVFDEIDAGVSGRIAQAVGISLRQLAESHQIICITHLPQIASMAQHHFLVEKYIDERFTRTSVRTIEGAERREQIARLFGGEKVTEAHLTGAADLIKEAEALVRNRIEKQGHL